MNRVQVLGCGVVSPAGWGIEAFRAALENGSGLKAVEEQGADGQVWRMRRVPARKDRPPWMLNPRMRRSGLITQYAMAAAWEALGGEGGREGWEGLGVICCVMGGSVVYSRRFYAEVLVDPSTASPLLFPETVFNAPASHVGAVLGAGGRNDTLVGDQSMFVAALVQAADWMRRGAVRSCLVIGAEEADWTTAEAGRVFRRESVSGEGAAAIWLGPGPGSIELRRVTEGEMYLRGTSRTEAMARVRAELGVPEGTPVFGSGGVVGVRDVEAVLGDGRGALGGWACVAAADAVGTGGCSEAGVCVAGSNQQVIGAVLGR
jgi:hypothetical protein